MTSSVPRTAASLGGRVPQYPAIPHISARTAEKPRTRSWRRDVLGPDQIALAQGAPSAPANDERFATGAETGPRPHPDQVRRADEMIGRQIASRGRRAAHGFEELRFAARRPLLSRA